MAFPSLWQMTEEEKAELKRIEAKTDRIYLEEGVLLSQEVGFKGFKHDNDRDLKSRLELSKDMK